MKRVGDDGEKQSGCGPCLLVRLLYTKYKQSNRNAVCRDTLLGEAKWGKAAFVTDRFALYRFESVHQYCLAHLKRDLKRFSERTGLDGEWGAVMMSYLDKLFEF